MIWPLVIKNLLPSGLIKQRHRKFRMTRLGLSSSPGIEADVDSCHFDLWPPELRYADKPWTLVDVGANNGDFIASTKNLAKLDCVFAFEPLPGCQEKLQALMKVVPNGQLFPVAVGSGPGELEFLCTANSKMSSSLHPDTKILHEYKSGDFSIINRITVPQVCLDDVIPAHHLIGLLKIDVQGFELAVLEGAKQTLKNSAAVLLEVNYIPHYKGSATIDDVCAAMREQGFRTFGISAPYMGINGPMWADAMFVKVRETL